MIKIWGRSKLIILGISTFISGLLVAMSFITFTQVTHSDINCGEFGISDSGICTCDYGYVDRNNFCHETCSLEPCKALNKQYSKLIAQSYQFNPLDCKKNHIK